LKNTPTLVAEDLAEHFTDSDNSPKVRQVRIRSTNGIDENTGIVLDNEDKQD